MAKEKIYVKRTPPTENHPDGYFYLGKSKLEGKRFESYLGSGKIWKKHLKKHRFKKNDIDTWVLHETEDKEDLKRMGIYYSNLFNVVESELWANLRKEDGDGGDGSKYIDWEYYNKYKRSRGDKHWTKQLWAKQMLSEKIKGDKNPARRPEVAEKISRAKKGKKNPKNSIIAKKRKGELNAFYGKTHSDKFKQKMRELKTGVPLSEQHKVNLSIAIKNRDRYDYKDKQKECPHCGVIGGGGNMKRYHFDNCKSLKK